MKTLITGISGSGKSTIVAELKRLGEQTVDLDTAGVCGWFNKASGVQTQYKEGAGPVWINEHRWQVITPKLVALMQKFSQDRNIYVAGKVARIQIPDMTKIFDRIILLKPNDEVIDERLSSRISNADNFARTKEERETIIKNRQEFEDACLDAGAILLDNHGTVEEVVKKIDGVINNTVN